MDSCIRVRVKCEKTVEEKCTAQMPTLREWEPAQSCSELLNGW